METIYDVLRTEINSKGLRITTAAKDTIYFYHCDLPKAILSATYEEKVEKEVFSGFSFDQSKDATVDEKIIGSDVASQILSCNGKVKRFVSGYEALKNQKKVLSFNLEISVITKKYTLKEFYLANDEKATLKQVSDLFKKLDNPVEKK